MRPEHAIGTTDAPERAIDRLGIADATHPYSASNCMTTVPGQEFE